MPIRYFPLNVTQLFDKRHDFSFCIGNFHFQVVINAVSNAYGIYVFQLIRHYKGYYNGLNFLK